MTEARPLRVDHIVITVSDLAAAVRDYEALGFTVAPGGTHMGGASHNALIIFHDGSYLELLAFTDPSVLETARQFWADGHLTVPGDDYARSRFPINAGKGEGLMDYALLAKDVDALTASWARADLPIEGPISGGRKNPDGAQMAWKVAMPHSPILPFVISDETPRSLRVPEGAVRDHANGVMGLAGLMIAVPDLAQGMRQYEMLLGVRLKVPIFDVKGMLIRLAVMPDDLRRRGPGPAALSLRARHAGNLDPAFMHGATIRLVSP